GEQGGLSPERQEEARQLALNVLTKLRDGKYDETSWPSEDAIGQMLDYMTGSQATGSYLPLLLEELEFKDQDRRAPQWRKDELAPGRTFRVVVIGAGMSGILAGIRLQQAGIPFTIIEKNEDVGGTWFENRYPGARVDNSNHLYSYSFAQKKDWPYYYSTREVLHGYFSSVAEEHGIRDRVRFSTEVTSVEFDEADNLWRVHVRSRNTSDTIEAEAVISAVGQLNRPRFPEIEGRDDFKCPAFHSAEWDDTVDLRDKRVAVIGNAASASQLIPIVAEQAAKLTIFQRTPNWYIPVPNYHERVAEGMQWLFEHVPHYSQWYRFWLFWISCDGLLAMAKVDPDWPGNGSAVGPGNDQLREFLSLYLMGSLQDRPDLVEKVLPKYPPAAKRIVLDNGVWPNTLKRDNVELITVPMLKITERGIVTEDEVEHEADVIIYATGFKASHFLVPMKVVGRGGIELHEQWAGDARAYMGITVPNFPNFFMMYGPNTNIVVNGSIVYFSECEVQYIMDSLRLLLEQGHQTMDCRRDVHDRYNQRIDAGNRQMAWGASTVNSWYKNEHGRVTQNWPFTLLEYWQQTKQVDPADYTLA
ncbi:MAG TPA: NAD(P)/FAD-dependent oxidoreductase, partial [Dehalococcoidia bacterium]|nr:NAD(P)/FAD-dependent oxidoreductase [Dehalococcoidia bacterium]